MTTIQWIVAIEILLCIALIEGVTIWLVMHPKVAPPVRPIEFEEEE